MSAFNLLINQNMKLSTRFLGGEDLILVRQGRTISALFENPIVPDDSMGARRMVEQAVFECDPNLISGLKKGDDIVRVATNTTYQVVEIDLDKTNGAFVVLA